MNNLNLNIKKKVVKNLCLTDDAAAVEFPPRMSSLCCSRAVVGGSRLFSLLCWGRALSQDQAGTVRVINLVFSIVLSFLSQKGTVWRPLFVLNDWFTSKLPFQQCYAAPETFDLVIRARVEEAGRGEFLNCWGLERPGLETFQSRVEARKFWTNWSVRIKLLINLVDVAEPPLL